MKTILFIGCFAASILNCNASANSTDLSVYRNRIFDAVYEEHQCNSAQYYTESVCEGDFLSLIKFDAQLEAYVVEYEFEPGFYFQAVAFLDGETTVTYWQN